MDSQQTNTEKISIEFLSNQLDQSFLKVWETTICRDLKQINFEEANIYDFPWIAAVAWIGGSWTGNIRIGMPKELACIIAGRLLETGIPPEEHIHDAVKEISNMIAGNFKSALPGRCGLATPGSYEIYCIEGVHDEFEPVIINWYESSGMSFFLALSELHPS